jgi:YHS domain-containing protein
MENLDAFAQRIEACLRGARKEPQWTPAERDRWMSDLAPRRRRFEELAMRLVSTVAQPRLEKLASYFSHAKVSVSEKYGQCTCRLSYCERFPANVVLEISVEHDLQIEQLFVCYELRIAPAPWKYDAHDKLTFELDRVDEGQFAKWLEDRLLGFLEIYLQLDRGLEDFDDEIVTDPVCGMRFRRGDAVARDAHRGQPYYFCSVACQQQVATDPAKYIPLEVS